MHTTHTQHTPEVEQLINTVRDILGDFAQDRYGYGAASKMLDWPTRAALATALHNAEGREHP
jgi:hypothetical protein